MGNKIQALLFLMTATLFYPVQGANNDHAGMDHSRMGHGSLEGATKTKASDQSIKLSMVKIEDKGDKKIVQIRLDKIKDNSPVTLDNLKEVHTEKIHCLIIDDALEDYSHVHPKPTADLGVYEFEWHPQKKNAHYRIWADLFPLETNAQEFAMADLTMGDLITSKEVNPKINRAVSLVNTVGALTFKLTLDPVDLQVGKASMGKITIVDDKGEPFTSLEPIMGSFAHIVGFADDFKSISHVHPMGAEPTKDSQRGGPELQFHLEPETGGFIKLFAQVNVQGKELYAPFGLSVKP